MDTESKPLVSVVTPVYNMGNFLPECIESVLHQTYKNFEYIIVNNCSTDQTLEAALGYKEKDSRIQVHSNDKFVGVIENHNIAFRFISPKSKYCKVVSADDWIFPSCLMQLIEFAEANPSVGIVGSLALAGRKVTYAGLEYERKIVRGSEICSETLKGGPYVFGSPTANLYRADLIRRSRDFYPGNNPHADTTACYESLKYCDFGFVHQILSYIRIHAGTQNSKSIKFGVIKLSSISDLIRFGPEYLSERELKSRLSFLLDDYYDFLASNVIRYLGYRAFWKQQKIGIQEAGFRLSLVRLCRVIFIKWLKLLLKPKQAFKKILAVKNEQRNAAKIEAKYH